jgi:hypothetical protein
MELQKSNIGLYGILWHSQWGPGQHLTIKCISLTPLKDDCQKQLVLQASSLISSMGKALHKNLSFALTGPTPHHRGRVPRGTARGADSLRCYNQYWSKGEWDYPDRLWLLRAGMGESPPHWQWNVQHHSNGGCRWELGRRDAEIPQWPHCRFCYELPL